MSEEKKATAAEIAKQLRDRTTLRYMADCKCGKCQCVPLELIVMAATLLERPVIAWRPIDTAPRDGSVILVLRPLSQSDTRMISWDVWKNGAWWCSRPGEQPGFWMPLHPRARAALSTKQEGEEPSPHSVRSQALEEAAKACEVEADRIVRAGYYGGPASALRGAAEIIRALIPLPAPDAGWNPSPPDYEMGKWRGLEEAALIVEDHYWDGCNPAHGTFLAKTIRALIPAPPVGDGSSLA